MSTEVGNEGCRIVDDSLFCDSFFLGNVDCLLYVFLILVLHVGCHDLLLTLVRISLEWSCS